MTQIRTIDYIVHPTFALHVLEQRTRNLVKGLCDYMEETAYDSSRIRIVVPNGEPIVRRREVDDRDYDDLRTRLVQEHKDQMDQLRRVYRDLITFEGEASSSFALYPSFEEFLKKNGLEIHDGVRIRGHGVYTDICVSTTIGNLSTALGYLGLGSQLFTTGMSIHSRTANQDMGSHNN